MGLFRDTYNITKVDMSGVENQMKKRNDIQEKQNIILNNTKDRVDISLNEYTKLKDELFKAKQLLKAYDGFVTDLAKSIKQNPEILLNARVIKSEMERTPYIDGYNLYVIWEIDREQIEELGWK